MISNQILHTTVDGLKAISRVDFCVIDADGKVAAKTFEDAQNCIADAIAFMDSPAESQVVNGYQFFKVLDDQNLEYILLAKGTSDDVYMLGKLAAFQIQNLFVAYKERFDKDNFIKNLLLDNLLRVDMYTRAEKLHIETDVTRVSVAFGTIVNEIKDVSRSYKEAKMALDVGKIFYSSKNVVAYSKLGIGRLIYQLPLPLCRMFIKEIFDGKSPDEFDEETLTTINKFFENSLNVSETSRQLYIHRNTLVYRLDKLQKSTGLDLRVFEDAITFKIALMVVKYMKYMENLDY